MKLDYFLFMLLNNFEILESHFRTLYSIENLQIIKLQKL